MPAKLRKPHARGTRLGRPANPGDVTRFFIWCSVVLYSVSGKLQLQSEMFRDNVEGKLRELRGALTGDEAEEAHGKAQRARRTLKAKAEGKLYELQEALTWDKAARAQRKAQRAKLE